MGKYALSRLGYMVVTFIVIATLTFLLMQGLPGSPYKNAEKLSPAQIELLNERYGLDDPLPERYVTFWVNMFQGDLGQSFQYPGRDVLPMITARIQPSAVLGLEAIILGTVVGLILGIIAALRQNTSIDYIALIIAVLGISIPSFVFAGVMQYSFGVEFRILPVAGWDGLEYHVMPVLALSVVVIATVARFMRTEMIEVLGQDYIITARAKGVSPLAVIIKHSIRNALIPVITILGPLVVSIVTGSLVIERIFGIPGIGEQFVQSILVNDYPVIMGTTLFYSVIFIVTIFLIDIFYGIIDPRIRLAGGSN
ncbi:ABC transporter permease [Aureibacillus halotolerans]|uniref:Oligopeptide transport system permease protein n=1 Tax=Aureibacillus halotolerans TaxID=1508390 RepID=A0A4V3D685_9BACI|nr:ABC transporter permease [Aureibacillus halotolerans]TDQ42817.1 oligopeptide transport system permease protein [Aureibacillus halotolerans]